MENESFNKLSEALGTFFEEDTENVPAVINKNLPVVPIAPQETIFEDKIYLQERLKNLVENSETILTKLATDIKTGSDARKFEVYGELLGSITNTLKELRDLNKMSIDTNIMENPNEVPGATTNVNVFLSSSELQKMMESAREKSEINKIDATFEIVNDEKIIG